MQSYNTLLPSIKRLRTFYNPIASCKFQLTVITRMGLQLCLDTLKSINAAADDTLLKPLTATK